ncbi:hypothetical protein ACFLUA_02980 [Chloroflexota bacterium]
MTFQFLMTIVVLGFLSLPNSHAQESNRAGLVIQYEEDRIETYCISFEEETIRGYELLELSELELELEYSSLGVAVCKIEDMGCPPSECLICEIPKYWSYWHLVDGDWVYSPLGVGNSEVSDGGVDGWSWGNQELPKLYSFDEICNPTPTPTSTPTFTYTIKPTNTPRPTNTPKPKPTKTAAPINTPPIPPTASYSPSINPPSPPTQTTVQYPTETFPHIPTSTPTISTSFSVEPYTPSPLATKVPTITNLLNTDPKEKSRRQSNSEEGGLPSKATGIVMPTRQTTPTLFPNSSSGSTSPLFSIMRNMIDFLQNLTSSVYSP